VIPNQFHFVFGLRRQREPFHLVHYLCLESCRQVNRPDAIHFYYHYEPHGVYWDIIRPYLTLEKVSLNPLVKQFRYKDALMKGFRHAHHADFIRLEKLLERGGVYADIDTLFVRKLPAELFEKSFVMGRESDVCDENGRWAPSLCNALMMSAPGAEFGRQWLESMAAQFDGSWSNHSTLFPWRLAQQFPEKIHIEPERSFFHFPPSTVGLISLFDDCQPIPNGVYSLHLWAHLWWDESRVDFSQMHAGLLTSDFIQHENTTYNMAARRFLPTVEREPAPSWFESTVAHAKRISGRWEQEARAQAGLTLFPLFQKSWPHAKQGLRHARAYQAHKAAARRFAPRNRFEAAILRCVLRWDEYGVFSDWFEPEDVVIDVGAHIGAFSFACYRMGSRNVHAFEADPGNFERLKENVSGLPGISPHYAAVFRSDLRSGGDLLHSGPVFANTGAGTVVFGQNLFEHLGYGELKPERIYARTPTIALDDILRQFDSVRLLKLDCEGSEYPILLTSRELHRVERIVGEFHVIPPESMSLLVPEARIDGHVLYDAHTLREALEAAGFEVTMRDGCIGLGPFSAARKRDRSGAGERQV